MKTLIFLTFLTMVVGCRGPLTVPAIQRLDPDEQAIVNRMWNNMLSDPNRLDRELLLDVMLTYELHESGVDKAIYHAEKEYASGTVLMNMSFDRHRPLDDWFTVEIVDGKKNSLRKEHYSGEEIWSHAKDTTGFGLLIAAGATTQPATRPTTQATTEPTDSDLRNEWMIARMKQIAAATQPAR